METIDRNTGEGITITNASQQNLKEAGRWANFLAIVGFVMLGLMVLGAIAMFALGSILPLGSGMSAGAAGVVYILMAALYFFPTYYLYQFSSKIKVGLKSTSQQDVDEAFQNLKSMFKFVGILMIIVLSIYVIMILFALMAIALA